MVTTWPPPFSVLGEGADQLARQIETCLRAAKIQVYGGNELVPPLEVFDAVSSGVRTWDMELPITGLGKVAASHIYYHTFWPECPAMNAWLISGGG
jgi:TRAP-type mannitol/chloroaromatic compound transport system substrate-binding protein